MENEYTGRIEDLEERFGIDLPEQDNYETVGGLVLAQAGRVPQAPRVQP